MILSNVCGDEFTVPYYMSVLLFFTKLLNKYYVLEVISMCWVNRNIYTGKIM